MNILPIGTSFSNAPWTVGGSNLWVSVLYLGFLLYVLLSFRSGQTELYFLTVTKEERPNLYWSTMGIMTIAASFALSKSGEAHSLNTYSCPTNPSTQIHPNPSLKLHPPERCTSIPWKKCLLMTSRF
jgi:hypothetical protein